MPTDFPRVRSLSFVPRWLARGAAFAALALATGGAPSAQAAGASDTLKGAGNDKSSITVGISVGVGEKIFGVVKQVAAKQGLDIKLVVFNDYQLPNAALNAGDLDANAFQHKPFLDTQIKARGFDIVPIGLTITAPLGFYSRKLKSLDELPEGASVGIQNDPSNGNRALLLLQTYKIITLKPEAVTRGNASIPDVVSNPRHIKLVALDAAQLPRSLDDLAAASINNDFAEQAGLVPARDAIARESATGPYANLIAVRSKDRDAPWAKKLVAAYQSPEVRAYIEKEFKGSLVPAF